MNDVVVNIAHTLTPLTRKEFNRPLLFVSDTREGIPVGRFTVYGALEEVAQAYGTNSVAYAMARAIFSQRIRPADMAIYNVGAWNVPSDLSGALDDLLNAGHTGWYYLVPSMRSNTARAALVNWVNAQRRVMVFGNADDETPEEFIAAVADLPRSPRAVAVYHTDNDATYLEAAMVGWVGGRYPATAAWFHAKVEGVQINGCTYDQLIALETANIISWWRSPIGIWLTTCGKTIGGEWCDITVALDLIEARIRERVWALLADRDRIPYTQEGIDLLAHAVLTELHYLARPPYGIIATDTTGRPMCRVMPPRREEIDPLEVRNRRIPDLPFEATVAGAVKTVVINGLVTEEVVPAGAGAL